ncbi:hypothetical protein QFZ20_004058 [Flavobacterium sp. W4I14]|nr:hypothetical protein [Flavobacterium sp. W4I14]
METYSKGVNGAFSGKVGSVIGSNWRSILMKAGSHVWT